MMEKNSKGHEISRYLMKEIKIKVIYLEFLLFFSNFANDWVIKLNRKLYTLLKIVLNYYVWDSAWNFVSL